MAGPNELWAWLQSIQQGQGAGQGPGGAGPGMGYPSLGLIPRSALGTPLRADVGPGGVGSGNVGVSGVEQSYLPQRQGGMSPLSAAPGAPAPLSDSPSVKPQPPTFSWPASSTPTGMPAPPAAPSPGPLATPSGQGGIGSDARFPLKRRAGAANLGYYAGGNSPTSMGGARNPTWTPYTNPNDPRIYRG
jgi:hypothetical protein